MSIPMQYLAHGLLTTGKNQAQSVKLSRVNLLLTIKSYFILKKETYEQMFKDALDRQVRYMNQRDALFNTEPFTSETKVIYFKILTNTRKIECKFKLLKLFRQKLIY
jgi:hypothetical protein